VRRHDRLGGGNPAGSGRLLRLDPACLPIHYETHDGGADGRVRSIELDRHRVVMRRHVRGMRMAFNLPLGSFLGVALHLAQGEDGPNVSLVLEHRDPALSVPLYCAADGADVLAEWSRWAKELGCPRLTTNPQGVFVPVRPRLGALDVAAVGPRRRRRSAHAGRRPSILMRRKGGLAGERPVHAGEAEIVART
jgi:Family of unknown function (DUF6101)